MNDRLDKFVDQLIMLSVADADGAWRLPPERELCARLDVSRGALREQLATLESLGILRRRQGHGSYIDAPDESFIRTYFTLMRRLGYFNAEQFAGAREMLEETVAAEAAACVTDADIDQLNYLAEEIVVQSTAGNAEKALDADFAFHGRLYAIVDNPIFNVLNTGFSHVLYEEVRARRDFAGQRDAKNPDGSINTDRVHSEIVDALAARSSERAREAVRKHFAAFSALTLTSSPVMAQSTAKSSRIGDQR